MSFRTFKTLIYSLVHRSDVRRWSDIGNHDKSWSGRTLAMSKHVEAGESVFEFGAGRRHLQEMLPPGCVYTPSDIAERAPGTIICDLNKHPLPHFPRHDVAFCSGVLEYIHHLDLMAAALAKSFDRLIVSYADIDRYPKKGSRIRYGWFNHFSRRKFVGKFETAGYRLDEEAVWEKHGIYVFKLTQVAADAAGSLKALEPVPEIGHGTPG